MDDQERGRNCNGKCGLKPDGKGPRQATSVCTDLSYWETQEKDEQIWAQGVQDMSQWKPGRVSWGKITWQPSHQVMREFREAWNMAQTWVGFKGENREPFQGQHQLDFSHWAKREACHLLNLGLVAWLNSMDDAIEWVTRRRKNRVGTGLENLG